MRMAFVETLTDLMRKHEDIITITPDMGFSVFEELQHEFPNRFFNTGVTEQSTIGLSTGLAMTGYKVFVYAQSIFLTLRSFEQVRLDVAYHHANVKIIGTAAGFWLNQLGVSHFALEDVGAMRMLPGMTILTPGDPKEAVWATEKAYETAGPVYIRLGKPDRTFIHTKKVVCEIGDILQIIKGDKSVLLVSGGMLPKAIEVATVLKKYNIPLSIYSVPTIKPINKKQLISLFNKYSNVFTLEEHSVVGGLGSAIAEFIVDNHIYTVKFHSFGTPDQFIHTTGSREYLLEQSGLSSSHLVKQIKGCIQK